MLTIWKLDFRHVLLLYIPRSKFSHHGLNYTLVTVFFIFWSPYFLQLLCIKITDLLQWFKRIFSKNLSLYFNFFWRITNAFLFAIDAYSFVDISLNINQVFQEYLLWRDLIYCYIHRFSWCLPDILKSSGSTWSWKTLLHFPIS